MSTSAQDLINLEGTDALPLVLPSLATVPIQPPPGRVVVSTSVRPPPSSSPVRLALGDNSPRVKPYGSLWANMLFATSRTNPGSFTFWVLSEQDQGEAAFEVDARRSRLGLDIVGPDFSVAGADFDSGGRIEIDFFGQFLSENRGGALLRHAYLEFSNDDCRVLAGQTWDLISPLVPGTLNYSVGWTGGNIGFRRAQLRLERVIRLEDQVRLLIQGSLNQDVTDDFPGNTGVRRESVSFPLVMARTAMHVPVAAARDIVIGISGHYGQTGFDFLTAGPPPLSLPPHDDARFDTWSMNLDAEVPLGDGLTFRGELFRGSNLSPFLGGIGQGVCGCLREPIDSSGGWFEVVKVWSESWESHIGAGIDDPDNDDSLLGRVQNNFVFANHIWHITESFSTGCEVSWWRTLYQERRVGLIAPDLLTPSKPGEAVTVEWMVRYDF